MWPSDGKIIINGSDPAINAKAVTPSDNADVWAGHVARAFRVSQTAGDVTLVLPDGTTATIPDVQKYETISVCFTRIKSTGTAAAGITAFF